MRISRTYLILQKSLDTTLFTGVNLMRTSKYLIKTAMIFMLCSKFIIAIPPGIKIPTLLKEDSILIAESYNLWKQKGEQLWKGWTSINIPMLYIKKDFEYLIFHPKPSKNFKLLGKNKFLNTKIYGKKRSREEGLAASFDVNGINSVVIGTPEAIEQNPSGWVIIALHEMFHVFQGEKDKYEKVKSLNLAYGKDASWMLEFPFPYGDKILHKIIHMQGYVSYLGLTSKEQGNILYNTMSLIEAIDVYKGYINLKYKNDKNYKYSKFQEWTEGIAKYTEYKMAELAVKNYTPIPGFQNLINHVDYEKLWEDHYKKQLFVIKHCGKGTGGRLSFYYLGLAKGLLLDIIFPKWKNNYFDRDIWLDDIFVLWIEDLQKKAVDKNE